MAKITNNTILTLYGGDAPIEVDVQPNRENDLVSLFARLSLGGQHLTIAGDPQDVRAFLNNALDAVDEAMAPLTECQRRGKHNWEASGPEDGCLDCQQEPLAQPVLVGNAPF